MAIQNLDILKDFFQTTIDKIAKNMATMKDSKGRNRYASGNTAKQIGQEAPLYEVKQSGDVITLNLFMPAHYDFIDKGVNGLEKKHNSPYSFRKASPPPLGTIRQFMLHRGIVPRGKDGKRLKTTEGSLNSLAFIIGRSIKKNGIEGIPYYSSVINTNWVTSVSDILLKLYGNDILDKVQVNFIDHAPKPIK